MQPIIMERVYNTSIKKVWQAITDNNQMKQWYFDIAEFNAEVGFEFQFTGEGKEGEKYIHLCKVMEVIPEKKLKYGWRYNGYAGNSFVTYDLSAEDEKTKLTLTHQGIETFPATANTDLIYKLAQYFTIGIYQTLPHKSYMKFQPTHIGLK